MARTIIPPDINTIGPIRFGVETGCEGRFSAVARRPHDFRVVASGRIFGGNSEARLEKARCTLGVGKAGGRVVLVHVFFLIAAGPQHGCFLVAVVLPGRVRNSAEEQGGEAKKQGDLTKEKDAPGRSGGRTVQAAIAGRRSTTFAQVGLHAEPVGEVRFVEREPGGHRGVARRVIEVEAPGSDGRNASGAL